ncbi:MAG: AAA family ATPase, partial [Pirellulaceae bacterium]
MSKLVLREFRVQNFRNINDSGWIPLERVTALVGRNESGKTALLKALHKFNPASDEPFNPQRDFPRDRFTRDYCKGNDWPACSAKFTAEPELWDGLELEEGQAPSTVIVTRYYDSSLAFEFDPMPPEPILSRDGLDAAFHKFRADATALAAPAPEQEETYQSIRTDLLNWCDSC